MSAVSRELARRQNGTLEVKLLWHTDTDRLCVCVHDTKGGDHFQIEVAPFEAMDVFNHPYAYAAARGTGYCRHDRAKV
jgi:hypothetical protein